MGKKQTNEKIDKWGKWMDGIKQIRPEIDKSEKMDKQGELDKWQKREWIDGR